MSEVRDYSNPQRWTEVWQSSFEAGQTAQRTLVPIPKINVPVLITTSIFAVKATSRSVRDNWYFAGYANNYCSSGLEQVMLTTTRVTSGRKLGLNQWNIIELPTVASMFALELVPPKYFRDITYIVQQYNGPIDTTENEIVTTEVIPLLHQIALKLGISPD